MLRDSGLLQDLEEYTVCPKLLLIYRLQEKSESGAQ